MPFRDGDFECEAPFTVGAGSGWITQALAATMKACPDLSAAQATFPDAAFRITRLVILNQTAATEAIQVARTAALGTGGTFQSLSDTEKSTQTSMRYAGGSTANSIAWNTPVGACTVLVQVSFRIQVA